MVIVRVCCLTHKQFVLTLAWLKQLRQIFEQSQVKDKIKSKGVVLENIYKSTFQVLSMLLKLKGYLYFVVLLCL